MIDVHVRTTYSDEFPVFSYSNCDQSHFDRIVTIESGNESGAMTTKTDEEAQSLYGLTYNLPGIVSIDTMSYSSVTYLDQLRVTYTETYKYDPDIELSDYLTIQLVDDCSVSLTKQFI